MEKTGTLRFGRSVLVAFVWQNLLLLCSLFIMTLGVALAVRSNLGSSVISSAPLAFTLAGEKGLVPQFSLGIYTNILNCCLVGAQMIVLRRRFEAVQLLQLLIGFVFGVLIDINMAITSHLDCSSLPMQLLTQILGCTVLGIGIALEVRCGSITMPGEGLPVAISRITGTPFPKVKIFVDIALVFVAIVSSYIFFGKWMWNIVGLGTLFAMVYVGFVVKTVSPHLRWFEKLLAMSGFKRKLYGLARFIGLYSDK